MPRKSAERKQDTPPAAGGKAPAGKPNQSVRMDPTTYDRWGVWCKVNGMTLEQSIVYLMKEHPIDAKRLGEWMKGEEARA